MWKTLKHFIISEAHGLKSKMCFTVLNTMTNFCAGFQIEKKCVMKGSMHTGWEKKCLRFWRRENIKIKPTFQIWLPKLLCGFYLVFLLSSSGPIIGTRWLVNVGSHFCEARLSNCTWHQLTRIVHMESSRLQGSRRNVSWQRFSLATGANSSSKTGENRSIRQLGTCVFTESRCLWFKHACPLQKQ